MSVGSDPERQRLAEGLHWMVWGPYLSQRQWGTVREDYSPNGSAWEYFPHDHARSRAYRWGEDGIAGFSDYRARICLSVALWNGRDAILKERMFGLTNREANHGEDIKELFYYLDATPTHSYMRMLYKYPQAPFPYDALVDENHNRGLTDLEYELLDTGIFDEDRYFDVFVEYAKREHDDILLRVTAHNRGPETAALHVLPQVWFRNTWSWSGTGPRPHLQLTRPGVVGLEQPDLGAFVFEVAGVHATYFCENDTNKERVFGDPATLGYFKDAIHSRVVEGKTDAVNPLARGTKAAAHTIHSVQPGASIVVRARLGRANYEPGFNDDFDAVFEKRRQEADTFYSVLQRGLNDPDERQVQRQALAGMIWSKQFYHYDVNLWLKGDPAQPAPPPERVTGRNADWDHLYNADVISMPDKWEYPWYAAWDLGFHCLPLALVDPGFAKRQLLLMTREWYMHPSGQLPAYEWSFSDANPPVHAWATWRVFQIDRKHRGDAGDIRFLERVFHKLLINFTWWVNRKDVSGNNVFQGGFLGLDNIGVFDRSQPLPTGGRVDQADGTAWMAMYSLNLMRIALELAEHNDTYEDIASKFFEHFLHIANAMTKVGDGGLWDEEDAFYYDWLELPGASPIPLRVRSLVGLIPLFAVEVLDSERMARHPGFQRRLEWLLNHRKDLADLVSHWDVERGVSRRRLLSLLRGYRMKALLRRLLDESEFLSPYGIRALSKVHQDHPFRFEHEGQEFDVRYVPGESDSTIFGGNSNWRGPVWMPVNFLIIESLQRFHHYYGPEFRVECPTGSGQLMTLLEVSEELTRRLVRLFTRDEAGRRPIFGNQKKLQEDPHFRDHLLFYEYFHGDNGRGVGASHQTGWTGLIAKLLQPRRPD